MKYLHTLDAGAVEALLSEYKEIEDYQPINHNENVKDLREIGGDSSRA